MLCVSLNGRGVSGRMDTCMCSAEFLPCSPEINTTLLTGNILVQNKKFKAGGKKIQVPSFNPLYLSKTNYFTTCMHENEAGFAGLASSV